MGLVKRLCSRPARCERIEVMIQIQQLKLSVSHTAEQLEQAVCRIIKMEREQFRYEIARQSLDARKKPELYYVYTIWIWPKAGMSEKKIVAKCRNKQVTMQEDRKYHFPAGGTEQLRNRPIIVGTGPAGLFCGLMLARHGYRPVLLERGKRVEERMEDVERFWRDGVLDPDSNVQFGEGGAGTFSDGKLNTLVKDSTGRNRKVLEEFVRAGAKKEILYQSKPHIGTDVLQTVVAHIREEILQNGGKIRYGTKVTGLDIMNGAVRGVELADGSRLDCDALILAVGHSARDTFAMLKEKKIPMEPKPFAVGVRVEHPQSQINQSQYGIEAPENLEAANYKLTARTANGRGVYSFCMCPGGYVVNASSEEGYLAVNGMSYSRRDGENANSAIIVTVTPEDYGTEDVLAGVEFQRELEKKAYALGCGRIPLQLYQDYKKNIRSIKLGEVKPSIKGMYQLANLRCIFPEEVNEALIDGIEQFDHKIQGFARGDALLSGVESRTSSPVRILRQEETLTSEIDGLYPCGEGAGYAGGITSAAMDGLRVAEAIAKRYAPG